MAIRSKLRCDEGGNRVVTPFRSIPGRPNVLIEIVQHGDNMVDMAHLVQPVRYAKLYTKGAH